MYHFNDKFYFWILKPVAQGYSKAVPEDMRHAVSNFFSNLTMPIRFVSSLLQLKIKNAGNELLRFVYNTTAGVGGLADAAKLDFGIKQHDEDLGQTLGSYGIGHGFYLVWPFLGPSSLRDTICRIGDGFLDPVSYVTPWESAVGINVYDEVNETTFHIGDYEDKPLSEPTVAANVLKWGTGAINIDGCRIEGRWVGSPNRQAQDITGGNFAGGNGKGRASFVESEHPSGRWPANLLLDEDAAAMLDEQGGNRRSAGMYEKGRQGIGPKNGPASIPIDGLTSTTYDDSGGASRFFYVAKADRAEREFGVSKNGHPTVKPVNLMRWLCRLITPPDGVILDPFLGSGTTGIAALQEGFRFIGIEQDEGYADTARRRIEADGHRQEVLL